MRTPLPPALTRWLLARPLTHVVGLAVGLRVGFLLVYALGLNSWELVPLEGSTREWAGTDGYAQIARTLWESGEYAYSPGAPPCHNRPPLTPGLLVAFGAWWPAGWWWVWWVFTVGAQVALLLLLRQAVGWQGWGTGAQAGVAWGLALHPLWLAACRASTFVVPGALLLGLCVWVWAHPRLSTLVRVLLLGGLGGLLALTHGTLALAAVLLAVGVGLRCMVYGWARAALCTGLCLVTTGTVVAPWTLRNRLALGEWLPVATGAGIQYWKGEGAYTGSFNQEYAVYRQATADTLSLLHFGPPFPYQDRIFADTALAHIAQYPARFVCRTLAGLVIFWAPDDQGPAKQAFTGLLNAPLVLLFGWGLWRRRRQLPLAVVGIGALVFGLNAVFALFYGNASYFLVVLPLLITGSGWAVCQLGIRATLSEQCPPRPAA